MEGAHYRASPPAPARSTQSTTLFLVAMRRACPFLGAALLVTSIACGAGAQASLFSHDVTADAATPSDSTKPQEGPDVTVRLGGLLQAWYIAGDGDPANTFRIRRAEFRITGTMSPRVGFTLLA